MKLFKRTRLDDIDHMETYDSDDDSIPPPPPPPPGPSDGQGSLSSPVKSEEQFIDAPTSKNAEHSRLVADPTNDEDNGMTTSKGYSQVPMSGHFRGMRKAQSFDEEEAGMDEIEVPSSSVVDRLNQWEHKYALKKRCRLITLIAVAVVVCILAISLGTTLGVREKPIELTSPSARIILEHELLPESSKNAIMNKDSNAAAVKALRWIQNSDANKNYGFDDEAALQSQDAQLNLIQRFTLATLFYSLNQEITGWMNEKDVCEWDSVQCDGNLARRLQEATSVPIVTTINIPDSNLKGSIPSEIVMLNDLVQLIMWGNLISGEIPDELYSLKSLEILDLYDNDISGTISSKIANLNNLEGLYIGKNKFSGVPPPELFDMISLIQIWMNEVDFDESNLPPEIGQLENLEILKISQSNFSGALPNEIGSLVNLKELSAARNILSGQIPDISTLVNLETLDLSNNWLDGDLPRLRDSLNLSTLRLNGNILSGRIPNHYGGLTKLVEVRLGPNIYDGFPDAGLTGGIPQSLGDLVDLEILDLQGNILTGAIPDSLTNLASLDRFLIQGNDITGEVPTGVCELDLIAMEADCDLVCACCTDACVRN